MLDHTFGEKRGYFMFKDTLFFNNVDEKELGTNLDLSFANANLGYTLVQAIIEYIDNAVDAKATEIVLCFYDEKIIIIDNGDGLSDVTKFFKVDRMPRKRERDAIGLFSCGSFSAFSVANRCSFISRSGIEESPAGISICYDQENGGKENVKFDYAELIEWFSKLKEDDEILKRWKSIVVIEGIHPEKNSIKLEDEGDYLYARLGQRYLRKLIEKTLSIKIWKMQEQEDFIDVITKDIQFVDPTFYYEKVKGINSFHRSAFQFNISMKEVALEIGETAVARYHEKYISHYSDTLNLEEFNKEELQIKYYVLKPVKFYDEFIEQNQRYAYYKPGGRNLSTGFYVYRNGIGIGDAAVDKQIEIDFTRQEINRFKAIIESTPAFDELLGINIRKDDFVVVKALAQILERKLKESIQNFLLSLPNGEKYKARELTPYIRNLFKAVDEYEELQDTNNNDGNESSRTSEEMPQNETIDTSQLMATIQGVLLYSALLTSDIKNKVAEWEKQVFDSIEEYNDVLNQAERILEAIRDADRLYLQDLQNSLARVERNMVRRVVQSVKYPILGDIDEPQNEQETVFFLLRVLENKDIIVETQELELERVFDYDTSKGIDFIGVTTEREDEYREHLISVLNCSQFLDDKKIYEKYQVLFNYRYSGVEIKFVITNGMSVGHSLATARFLVAWKTTIGTDGCINAEDGKYYKVQEKDGVYIYENSYTKHKIKVLILKEWGYAKGLFKVKNKSNR